MLFFVDTSTLLPVNLMSSPFNTKEVMALVTCKNIDDSAE